MLSSVQRDVLVAEVVLGVARTLPSSRPWIAADRVIWRDQNAPFPPEPFVSIAVLGSEEEGAEPEQIKGAGVQRVLTLEDPPPDGVYTVTIGANVYQATADSSTADDVLRALADEILEGGERVAATIEGETLRLFGLEQRDTFTIAVDSPSDALVLEELDPAVYDVLLEVVRKIWRVTVEIQAGTRQDATAPSHLQGPTDLLRRIDAHLGRSETDDRLQVAGLAIVRLGGAREFAARIRGSEYGRRGVLEAQIRVAALETASVTWIESVAGVGTLTGDALAEPITIPFESPPPEP